MSSIADLLAVGSSITFEGVEYKIRRPQLVEQARFSQYLKDMAKAESGRGDVPEVVREGLYRAAIRDVGELYYEVDSPGYVNALQTPSGFAKLLYFIFQTDHPNIDEEKVRQILESGLKEQFVRILVEEDADPKALQVVLAILGFPPDYLSTNANSSSDSPIPPTTGTSNESAV